jgi:hypothetical protein
MYKFRNKSLLRAGERVTDEQLIGSQDLFTQNFLATDPREAGLSRRGFMASAGLAAGAFGTVALAGCGGGTPTTVTPAPTPSTNAPTIGDVLNFALNLEYLEATFYLTLTTGNGLQASDMGTSPGAVTGGLTKVTFTDPGVQDLANQLAADEQAHVQFIRATMQALGITPVDMPALNLAALGPVTNDATFLAIARALETTGTSAYEGAITFLISNVTALNYAATIHATEGQHEGALRQYCVANNVTSPQVDSNDVPPTATAIFNTVGGLNTARTTTQVLDIVYAAGSATGVTKGGFYPNGFNGAIIST